MAVTIKKGWPFVLPPWKRFFNTMTGLIDYTSFDWSKQPVLTNPSTFLFPPGTQPLYQAPGKTNFPACYPRSYFDEFGLLDSIESDLKAANIFEMSEFFSGSPPFMFTRAFEINKTDFVSDPDIGDFQMPNIYTDKWQGGDALIFYLAGLAQGGPTSPDWYTLEAGPPVFAVAGMDMIAHDQAVLASALGLFNRIKFVWFYEYVPADPVYEAVMAILTSAVSGMTDCELNFTTDRSETTTIALARAHSFFGV